VGSDLREGIVTLPVLHYVRNHPHDERVAAVVRADGGYAENSELVREVVDAIRESGAVALAMERARMFIARSQAALSALPEGETREMMRALADYTLSRQV
jgi:geranylgeranyl pyrophosphate synthase